MTFQAVPLRDRLEAKIDFQVDGCWLWTASTRDGYGQIRVGRSVRSAHLVMWELIVGEVPEGLELDHLCRIRHCVNPKHLEPVTHGENLKRGDTYVRFGIGPKPVELVA